MGVGQPGVERLGIVEHILAGGQGVSAQAVAALAPAPQGPLGA